MGKRALEDKYEKLFLFGAISVRPDEEVARKLLEGDQDALVDYVVGVDKWVRLALARTVGWCCETLMEPENWAKLSKEPQKFDAALTNILSGTRTAMKLYYRIPDHRPSIRSNRDKAIAKIKMENPKKLTYGQVANRYNRNYAQDQITEKQAERAYARELKRMEHLGRRAYSAAMVYLRTHTWTKKELVNLQPVPQDILQVLTSSK